MLNTNNKKFKKPNKLVYLLGKSDISDRLHNIHTKDKRIFLFLKMEGLKHNSHRHVNC